MQGNTIAAISLPFSRYTAFQLLGHYKKIIHHIHVYLRWQSLNRYNVIRIMLLSWNKRRSGELISLKGLEISTMMGLLREHARRGSLRL